MKRKGFSIAHKDEEMLELVEKTEQKILAVWAIDCVKRVIHFFEEKYPEDHRPREALETLKEWIDTGVFKMVVIRKASLDAHAAARKADEGSSPRSAARACGQAVATAHVPRHSYGAAVYSQQAIFLGSDSSYAYAAAVKERDWQYQHLLELARII